MMMPPSPQTNGVVAARRRRRRGSNSSLSNSATESDRFVTTTTASSLQQPPPQSQDDDNNNYDRSSSYSTLDALLQGASAAMGLTPVHNSSRGSATSPSTIITRQYAPQRRRGSMPAVHPSQPLHHHHHHTNSTNNAIANHTNNNNDHRSSFELKQNALSSLQTSTLPQIDSALERIQLQSTYNSTQSIFRRLAISSSSSNISQKEITIR